MIFSKLEAKVITHVIGGANVCFAPRADRNLLIDNQS